VRLANVCNVGRLLKNKKCVSVKNKTLSGRIVRSAVIPICLFSLYFVLSIFMSLSFFRLACNVPVVWAAGELTVSGVIPR